jgi:hypothetical protein
MNHAGSAAFLLLRAALPAIRHERCDFIRTAAFELLATISPEAEREQLVITAAAVRRSAEAQVIMEECIAHPMVVVTPTPAPVPTKRDNATLRFEHDYLAYTTALHGLPAIPFEVWVCLCTERLHGLTETACHRDFDDYCAGRAEEGMAALPMAKFAPVWLHCRREHQSPEWTQKALRTAEAEAGLVPQAVS